MSFQTIYSINYVTIELVCRYVTSCVFLRMWSVNFRTPARGPIHALFAAAPGVKFTFEIYIYTKTFLSMRYPEF